MNQTRQLNNQDLKLFGPYCRREYGFTDETHLFQHKSPGRFICFRSRYDSPAMRHLLLNVDREMEHSGFGRIKHDNTTTVGFTSRDGRRLIIKRYNTKNNWHRVRRSLRRSRAQNCFDYALQLTRCKIATAPPVAYIETRFGPLKGRSWLITEFVEGSVCLDHVHQKASQSETGEIAARLERLFQKLSSERITHGDMKATNFILRHNRNPVLIDLDGMMQHRRDADYEKAHQKDLARFMKNWQKRPELQACFAKVKW